MKILVLGAGGLLGSTVFRVLGAAHGHELTGTVRDADVRRFFSPTLRDRLHACGDLRQPDELRRAIDDATPDVVVNCLSASRNDLLEADALKVLSILSVFPQQLAIACRDVGARLIQMSSDGVFTGARGNYSESDLPDATDLYGVAKILGEVRDPRTVSIRTSMIGHELRTSSGLLEWFLAQDAQCACYRRAIFSGLPTPELARVIRDFIIPNPRLHGIFHVSAAPISKLDLLRIVADVYGKRIDIVADDRVVMDRSLDSTRFREATGYVAAAWPDLIRAMRADFLASRPRH